MRRERLIPLREVIQRTRLNRDEVYRQVDAGTFPRPVRVTGTTSRFAPVAWVESEITKWIDATITAWRELERPTQRRRTRRALPSSSRPP